jgi:NAD(P)-dependent dehydrogenase (short-subunit alcohol dehydrogenase family)
MLARCRAQSIAEFVGTFAFVFIGAGAAAVVGEGVGVPGIVAIAIAHGLRAIELDLQSEPSIDVAVKKIMAESGKIDVLVHNAGHMMFGPAEAFLPEQFAMQYDVNVLGTQRVNRAVLPHMRAAKQGLLLWISSSSSAGGTPPYLAPYFAPKAAMDSLAVLYARELSRWGIETTIVVPGALTKGTNHFAHSGRPADEARVAEYEAGPYKGFGEEVLKAFAAIVPDDAEPGGVADERHHRQTMDLAEWRRVFRRALRQFPRSRFTVYVFYQILALYLLKQDPASVHTVTDKAYWYQAACLLLVIG